VMNGQFSQSSIVWCVADNVYSVLYLIMKVDSLTPGYVYFKLIAGQSEWFRDALSDLPPTSTKITLRATPASEPDFQGAPDATASSNARNKHRANVGQFQIQAKGDFGTTEVS
jgi:hypothetical protein